MAEHYKAEVFMKINVNNYERKLDKVQFYKYIVECDKDRCRFSDCSPTEIMKCGGNYMLKKKFLLEIYNNENHYNYWCNMLLVSDDWEKYIEEKEIMSIIRKSENVGIVLNEIKNLYTYNVNKPTDTFDYCNYGDKISRKVMLLLILINKKEIDIMNQDIDELVKRCKKVINYAEAKCDNYVGISNKLKKNSEVFAWLQNLQI
jgi:hypothetical protein